jgi:hypothetical protein
VFLRLLTKKNDRFLEQRMNIKFYVKLRRNESHACPILSEAYGGEAMINSSVVERHKRPKNSRISNEDNAHHFRRYQEYCSL